MVVRPSDWFLVELPVDPTPGDAFGIRSLASKYGEIAQIAGEASSGVRHARSSGAASAWVGDAGDVFRDRSERMPGELAKANDSYEMVAEALRTWAAAVDDTQAQADRGLQQAREAHADLTSARAALASAEWSWTTARAQQLTYQTLTKAYTIVPPPPGVTMPTDYQMRSVDRSAQHAQASIASARHAIADADARLAAARSLVHEAKARRDEAERVAVHRISRAGDNAVKPSSIWEAIQDSAAWQTVITIATVVLTIVSIVALFVGGPIVWAIILIATAVLLLNALMSIAQGKNAWGELAMLAIGLIPGGRFLTLGGRLLSTVAKAGFVGERFAATIDRLTTTVLRFTRLRPAHVATDFVDPAKVTDNPVMRTTLESLARGDRRGPEEMFSTGFKPWDATHTNYEEFVNAVDDRTAFVSTSTESGVASSWPGARYVYEIDAPGGIDANATLGARNMFSSESEITFAGGIRPEFIRGARETLPGGSLGSLIANPAFTAQNSLVRLLGLG